MLGGWDMMGLQGYRRYRPCKSPAWRSPHESAHAPWSRLSARPPREFPPRREKVANNPSGFGDKRNWKMLVIKLKLVNT